MTPPIGHRVFGQLGGFVALLTLCVFSLQAAPLSRLAGQVVVLEGPSIPPDVTLTLALVEVAPDTPSRLIARLTLPTQGRTPPYRFELPFYPADLRAKQTYHLQASLDTPSGRRLMTASEPLPATARRNLNLRLTAAPAEAIRVSLEDTPWQLQTVGGAPVLQAPDRRTPYLLLFAGRVSGDSGCNKLMGSYRTGNGRALHIGPLASTRMACAPDWMHQESALLAAIAQTATYRIVGDALELLDGERVLARFTARPTP